MDYYVNSGQLNIASGQRAPTELKAISAELFLHGHLKVFVNRHAGVLAGRQLAASCWQAATMQGAKRRRDAKNTTRQFHHRLFRCALWCSVYYRRVNL